jgi:hypothetical protein
MGSSYQTQLSIQKQILALRGQELTSVRNQMTALIAQGGEAVKNTEEYQELQRREASMAADLFKQSVGVQRDFLDKALGKVFGATSGSTFQPGTNNADYMAKRIFGEYTVGKEGLKISGQVGLDEQRRQLGQAAIGGLTKRPVGKAVVPIGNGVLMDPMSGGMNMGMPVPTRAAPIQTEERGPRFEGFKDMVDDSVFRGDPTKGMAANSLSNARMSMTVPSQPAMESPTIVDVSGNINIKVSFAQDGRLEAFIEKVVIKMAAQGIVVKGKRGLPGSGT